MLTTYTRLMRRPPVIETERCLICGQDRRDHEHGLDCARCECIEYAEARLRMDPKEGRDE